MKWLKSELERIKEQNLYRRLFHFESPPGKVLELEGRKFINFASNDYLGLASAASLECLRRWGAGSGASRLVSGSFTVHRELEKELARLKKTEDALLFSTGYMANVGVISALAGKGDLILSDSLNHASIIDGCRLSRADVLVYNHCDLEHLESLLKENRGRYRRCFLVTDSVFSMDGDLAPLDGLFRLKRLYGAVLIIDDAHATGVVGWSSLELFGLTPDDTTVLVGTLGKALGTFGAFVAGSSLLREYLINRCRSFIYTTALPPFVACQTLENLKLVPERMALLRRKLSFFRNLTGINSPSAVFPYLCSSPERALALSEFLRERGFWVPAIRPPTVKQSRLRISVTAEHTEEELRLLWSSIREFELTL
ncbi:aminotransferase class I/II-fold pyridoxal phosphate-dependent enzyme [Thermovibrio ammonificans]